jgi:L-fuconolactonase
MRVDSHCHYVFFSDDAARRYWTPADTRLRRDWLPDEIQSRLQALDFDGLVVMQTNESDAETELLLAMAAKDPFILGVVGWVDTTRTDVVTRLAGLAEMGAGALAGLRPMIFKQAADDWIADPAHDAFFAAATELELAVDLLCRPQHLRGAMARVMANPDCTYVLNHAGFPNLMGDLAAWKADIRALADNTNVHCKFSGFPEYAPTDWSVDDLRPITDFLIDTVGPARLMWASNWPVCYSSGGLSKWVAASTDLLASLTESEQAEIYGGTAQRAYRLVRRKG